MTKEYQPQQIELAWQERWEKDKTFEVTEKSDKPKYYVLEMFAYPSGSLHMGHVRNYTIGDVMARTKRMQGFNVLHPFGWDAFGLPAEQAAIKRNIHPAEWTYGNIAKSREQLKRLGIGYDWTRELATCDDDYAFQEQKLFLDLYEHGLVYKKESLVNWCDTCQTVLANEQVSSGVCWRCDHTVTLKPLSQWFFRTTKYADELLEGHKKLEGGWSDHILTMQKNWIGRSEGSEVVFPIDGSDEKLEVFTTRPDTLWGVTFMSMAPEHPMLRKLVEGTEQEEEIKKFIDKVRFEDQRRRTDPTYEKKGVFTGQYAINPVNNEKIPIFAANFVLMEYGSGAVMAVPGHDQRDFEFAKEYNLPIRVVIQPEGEELSPDTMTEAYEGDGKMVNSAEFSGKQNREMMPELIKFLEAKKIGSAKINYRLKDWGISRQRYWGNPIPMIVCEKCGFVPVPRDQLPVLLPKDVDFSKGGNPLDNIESFVNTKCPKCGSDARRDTDTMDTFVDSSWYYLRYTSPKYKDPIDKKRADYWTPVDQYVGGAEHACMHLIFARFFHKALRDIGLVNSDEPFLRLLNHGMVLKDGAVMSKSKGNVVDPDAFIEKYGADTLRLFMMFAAPPEKELEWNDSAAEGSFRFLRRVWRLATSYRDKINKVELPTATPQDEVSRSLRRKTYQTIQRVTHDLNEKTFQPNTAIAAMMELVNLLSDLKPETDEQYSLFKEAIETLLVLLNPIVPHMTEELWKGLGKTTTLVDSAWPKVDSKLAAAEVVTMVVQVNGKLRAKIQVPANIEEEDMKKLALENDKVKEHVGDKEIRKVIVVPKRLINIVV
ncbi:leucine--tRNA ligase [Bdellovibrionota bacterium]